MACTGESQVIGLNEAENALKGEEFVGKKFNKSTHS